MKRTTITLPEPLAELISREARRQQTSVSEVVRRLVLKGLGSGERRDLPWAGLFDDPGMVAGAEMDRELETWADDLDRHRR